jgi:hypothetical protein
MPDTYGPFGPFASLTGCGCGAGCPCTGGCPTGYHCTTTDGETFECAEDCETAGCPAGYFCSNKVCYPTTCTVDADCPPERPYCHGGTCVVCVTDGQCPSGYVCASNECVPTIGCDPPCGDGEICNPCGAPSCMACGDIGPTLGLSAGDAGYDGAYDFDCNGRVDYQDFTYWRSQCG